MPRIGESVFTFNKKRIILGSTSLALSLSVWGCVNPKDINWENTPITGTVLGTVAHKFPISTLLLAPLAKSFIRLALG